MTNKKSCRLRKIIPCLRKSRTKINGNGIKKIYIDIFEVIERNSNKCHLESLNESLINNFCYFENEIERAVQELFTRGYIDNIFVETEIKFLRKRESNYVFITTDGANYFLTYRDYKNASLLRKFIMFLRKNSIIEIATLFFVIFSFYKNGGFDFTLGKFASLIDFFKSIFSLKK